MIQPSLLARLKAITAGKISCAVTSIMPALLRFSTIFRCQKQIKEIVYEGCADAENLCHLRVVAQVEELFVENEDKKDIQDVQDPQCPHLGDTDKKHITKEIAGEIEGIVLA